MTVVERRSGPSARRDGRLWTLPRTCCRRPASVEPTAPPRAVPHDPRVCSSPARPGSRDRWPWRCEAAVSIPSRSPRSRSSSTRTWPTLDGAVRAIGRYRWVVITSANGARAIIAAAERASIELGGPRWAAIGASSGSILDGAGIEVDFVASRSSGETLAAELPIDHGDEVLVIRGDLAGPDLAGRLRGRDAVVDDVRRLSHAGGAGDIEVVAAPGDGGARVRRGRVHERFDGPGLGSLAASDGLDVTSIPAICTGRRRPKQRRGPGSGFSRSRPARAPSPAQHDRLGLDATPGDRMTSTLRAAQQPARATRGARDALGARAASRRTPGPAATGARDAAPPGELVAPCSCARARTSGSPSARCPASRGCRPTVVRGGRAAGGPRRRRACCCSACRGRRMPRDGAWLEDGIVQQALRALRERGPAAGADRRHLPVRVHRPRALRAAAADGSVDNDPALALLARSRRRPGRGRRGHRRAAAR